MISAPRRERFARRPRKKEGVYVGTRPSDDAGMGANRPGPKGCVVAAAQRQRAAWPDRQSGAAHRERCKPRTTTGRPPRHNAGYVEIVNRLLAFQQHHDCAGAAHGWTRRSKGDHVVAPPQQTIGQAFQYGPGGA